MGLGFYKKKQKFKKLLHKMSWPVHFSMLFQPEVLNIYSGARKGFGVYSSCVHHVSSKRPITLTACEYSPTE